MEGWVLQETRRASASLSLVTLKMVMSEKQDDVDPSFSAVQRLAREADELRAEIEQLKTDPYRAGYIDGSHDAHARRGESFSKCPRCS
jgi:hypothetical protein